jgi:hypothetical protein
MLVAAIKKTPIELKQFACGWNQTLGILDDGREIFSLSIPAYLFF